MTAEIPPPVINGYRPGPPAPPQPPTAPVEGSVGCGTVVDPDRGVAAVRLALGAAEVLMEPADAAALGRFLLENATVADMLAAYVQVLRGQGVTDPTEISRRIEAFPYEMSTTRR